MEVSLPETVHISGALFSPRVMGRRSGTWTGGLGRSLCGNAGADWSVVVKKELSREVKLSI